MNRKLTWLFTAILLVFIPQARAQQAKKIATSVFGMPLMHLLLMTHC